MGYYYSMQQEKIFIPQAKVEIAEATLAKIEQYNAWELLKDDEGNINQVYRSESKSYDEEALEAIAPYVVDGSFVEIQGEDPDDLFRLVFKNGKLHKIFPQIIWPEPA